MTFSQIVDEVCGRMNLTSIDAKQRVGVAVNRHYKRITASIGVTPTRFVTRTTAATIGQRTVTFATIEKIDRILDATTAASLRFPDETSIDHLRSIQPGSGPPNFWAVQSTTSTGVTVLLDNVPLGAYSLQADGIASIADLTVDDEPAFSESHHDAITWFVLAEEYLRKEKPEIALAYESKAKELVGELRFLLADSPSAITRQGQWPR